MSLEFIPHVAANYNLQTQDVGKSQVNYETYLLSHCTVCVLQELVSFSMEPGELILA